MSNTTFSGEWGGGGGGGGRGGGGWWLEKILNTTFCIPLLNIMRRAFSDCEVVELQQFEAMVSNRSDCRTEVVSLT